MIYMHVDEPLKLDPRRVLVPTGLILDIPVDSLQEFIRSGMATKKGIGLLSPHEIIDSDYVEEVFVPMVNNTEKYFYIRKVIESHKLKLSVNLKLMFMKLMKDQCKRPTETRFGSTQVN